MDEQILIALQRELAEWLANTPPSDGTRSVEGADIVLSTAKNARSDNQDRAIYVRFSSPRKERSFSLLAVMDGIGGMVEGGRCAEICISSLITNLVKMPKFRERPTILEALQIANREVWRRYNGRGGTTFAGVFFERNKARSLNIGDSHVYEYQPAGGLVQKSADDRLGNQFAKLKGLEHVTLNPELAGRLAQYVGMQGLVRPHVALISDEILRSRDNYLLLSTDGAQAHQFVGRDELRNGCDPRAIAQALVDRSSAQGDADNATVVCARATIFDAKKDRATYPFEHLCIWSGQGVFNFLFPNAEVRTFPGFDRRRERERQKSPKSIATADPLTPTSPTAPETPPATETKKTDAGETAKPQVTIRQLTLDHIPDEPTE